MPIRETAHTTDQSYGQAKVFVEKVLEDAAGTGRMQYVSLRTSTPPAPTREAGSERAHPDPILIR